MPTLCMRGGSGMRSHRWEAVSSGPQAAATSGAKVVATPVTPRMLQFACHKFASMKINPPGIVMHAAWQKQLIHPHYTKVRSGPEARRLSAGRESRKARPTHSTHYTLL
eukprot:scaffold176730_cov28-Tisochrysis_lutea.AAC.4